MNKNNEKAKVGRPKLADGKLKKESIIFCSFISVVIIIVSTLVYKTLKIEFDPKYVVGNVYNTHVNSCVIEYNKIDCGPNVTYMKYKIDNGKYIEVSKENSSIEVSLDSYKKITFCYKTNNTDMRCNK